MTLFHRDATLRVLILWAGGKRKPWVIAIRDRLKQVVPEGYNIAIITEDHSDARYNKLSEEAIKAADCVLMIASDEDWDRCDSAIREWEFFNSLSRNQKRTRNQFRFVRVSGEKSPAFDSAGLRPLSFLDPHALSSGEIETALNYFVEVKAGVDKAGGKSRNEIGLSTQTLTAPGGFLAATLWVATLDDKVLELIAPDDNAVSSRGFLGALRRLKALHSVHSGLGAMIKGSLDGLQQDLSAGTCNVTRFRAQIVNDLSAYRTQIPSDIGRALNDCIAFGLLPTLRLLARRLTGMPTFSKELLFVEAAMERLAAILDDRNDLESDVAAYDGSWWVQYYLRCLELVERHFSLLASDQDISNLVHPRPSAAVEERSFAETLNIGHNLLVATVRLTFLILVVFSFLHAHRPNRIEDLTPDKIEDAVEQLAHDWRHGHLTDAIVKWSNQMILCLLAAVSGEELVISAAA